MEWNIDGLSRLIIAAVAAIGLYATFILHTRQASKVRAELLEKFETAMEKEHKHSATELFHMIHGKRFRFNYSDIKSLIQDDKCAKIILALQKRSDTVSYTDGKLVYAGAGESDKFMKFERYAKLAIFFMLFGATVYFFVSIYVASGAQSVVNGLAFLMFSTGLFWQGNSLALDKIVDGLVYKKEEGNE